MKKLLYSLRRQIFTNRWEDELDEEIRFHLEMSKEQKMAEGMTEKEARQAALKDFGGVQQYKESTRDAWGLRILRDTLQDIGYAFRQMRRHPGFSIIVIMTLALCLGANTTALSLLKSLIIRPYDYPEAERVVMVGTRYAKLPEYSQTVAELSIPHHLFLEEKLQSFDSFGFLQSLRSGDLEAEGGVERVEYDQVAGGLWGAVGVQPILGRTFTEADVKLYGHRVAVISERIYKRMAAAGRTVLDEDIRLDGETYRVVGVMPDNFYMGMGKAALWIPRDLHDREYNRGDHSFSSVGRLADGVTLEQARTELKQLYEGFLELYPQERDEATTSGKTFDLVTVNDSVTQVVPMIKVAFISFQIVTAMVLLIGCLNVSGMIMIRGLARLRELAIRHSLGAGKFRLARQLMTEIVILFLFGVVGSMFVVEIFLKLALMVNIDEIPWGQPFRMDYDLFLASLGIAIVLALVTGSLPVISVLRSNLQGLIQANALTHSGGKGKHRIQALFVIGQVAFSTLLLVLSGVSLLNLNAVLNRDIGFDRQGRIAVQIPLPNYRFGRGQEAYLDQKEPFRRRVIERMSSLPGVLSVSAANRIPGSPYNMGHSGFSMPHYVFGKDELHPNALRNNISPGFFETLNSEIVMGRDFEDTDTWNSRKVVIVSKSVVDRYFHGHHPLGMTLKFWGEDLAIVGVVDDIQDKPFFLPESEHTLYFPFSQWDMYAWSTTYMLKVAGDPDDYRQTIRKVMLELDPNITMEMQSFDEIFEVMVFAQKLPMQLTLMFSILALFLTSLGLYGLVGYVVTERIREFGIRMAIGATPGSILKMVSSWSCIRVAIGLVAGLIFAAVCCHFLNPVFQDIDAMNPLVFIVAAVIIAIVAMIASLMPTLRAVRVSPAQALRYE